MKYQKLNLRIRFPYFLMGLPLVAVAAASLLPLRPVIQQALIGVVFLWIGISFMIGLPNS